MENITVIMSARMGQQIVDKLWTDLLDKMEYNPFTKIYSIGEELLLNLREGVRIPIRNSMFSGIIDVDAED